MASVWLPILLQKLWVRCEFQWNLFLSTFKSSHRKFWWWCKPMSSSRWLDDSVTYEQCYTIETIHCLHVEWELYYMWKRNCGTINFHLQVDWLYSATTLYMKILQNVFGSRTEFEKKKYNWNVLIQFFTNHLIRKSSFVSMDVSYWIRVLRQ